MPDWNELIPEERKLFCKFVHDLRKANKFLDYTFHNLYSSIGYI